MPEIKEYMIQGLHCPTCARKIQDELQSCEGIREAVVNFSTQSLRFRHEGTVGLEEVEERARRIIGSIEAGATLEENRERGKPSGEEEVSPVLRRMLFRLAGAAWVFGLTLLFRETALLPPGGLLVLFGLSYLLAGGDVLLRAFRNILRGRIFDENFLMAIATLGAWGIGEYPEASAVMLFYQLGEYLQERAVNRSRRSIRALTDLRPDEVRVIREGRESLVKPEETSPGEIFRLLPGERVPLDGQILEGEAMVDLSALTGESVPRRMGRGEEILAGGINTDGVLTVKILRSYGESAAARILKLVEEASERKARAENFISRFARYYTPAVFFGAVALSTLPPLLFGLPWQTWFYRSLVFLVVSCPCALVVSIPLSFFAGLGAASREGVLIKGGNYLDVLSRAERVVFDKTGTLTTGRFSVASVHPAGGAGGEELLSAAGAVEAFSRHPVARAVTAEAEGRNLPLPEVEDFREYRGQGVTAVRNGGTILAGTAVFLREQGITGISPEAEGTAVHVAQGGRYLGYLTVEDRIKEDAGKTVEGLKELGLKEPVLLTGDSTGTAMACAGRLGIRRVHAELLPHRKVEILEELEKETSRGRTLLFVGDGINDAPVLARADGGIAMGALGSDAAIEAADIVVMDDRPSRILKALRISRKTREVVIQNILLALSIKGAVLLLGAMGTATLWEAVFADVGTALLAILNSFRIGGIYRIRRAGSPEN